MFAIILDLEGIMAIRSLIERKTKTTTSIEKKLKRVRLKGLPRIFLGQPPLERSAFRSYF